MSDNTFAARSSLNVGDRTYTYYSLPALEQAGYPMARLPVSMRILLENLLRHEDGSSVKRADIETVAGWQPSKHPEVEIAFRVARVILQDFTGVQ